MAPNRPDNLPYWDAWNITTGPGAQDAEVDLTQFSHNEAFTGGVNYVLSCLAGHKPMSDPYNKARNKNLDIFFQIQDDIRSRCVGWPDGLGPEYSELVRGDTLKHSSFLSGGFVAIECVREEIKHGNLKEILVVLVDDLEASMCHRFVQGMLQVVIGVDTSEVVRWEDPRRNRLRKPQFQDW